MKGKCNLKYQRGICGDYIKSFRDVYKAASWSGSSFVAYRVLPRCFIDSSEECSLYLSQPL